MSYGHTFECISSELPGSGSISGRGRSDGNKGRARVEGDKELLAGEEGEEESIATSS